MSTRLYLSSVLLSTLLGVLVTVLWIRSYSRCDVLIGPRGPTDRLTITSEFGVFVFEVESAQRGTIQPGWSYFVPPLPRRFRAQQGEWGFFTYTGMARHYLLLPPVNLWGATIPHWAVLILTAILPGHWLMRRRRLRLSRERIAAGLCAGCGYDLRATQGRCPECGAVGGILVRSSGL